MERELGGLDGLITAEQDERRRVALFLHDGPLQQLSGIALMLDGALHALAHGHAGDAQRIITTALDRQRTTIRELRALSFALEPVVLRDRGFDAGLRALGDQLGAAHHVVVDVETDGVDRLGETAQIALYTIIRELAELAARRSPSTLELSVHVLAEGDVIAVVRDDADPERRRRSLEAIEARVHQLHGTVETLPGAVRITLPAHAAGR